MIDIYIGTESEQYDSLWQSSCGIILNYNYNDSQRHRILGFDLDIADPTFAKAQAVKLALASIHKSLRKTPVVIHLPDDDLLDKLVDPVDKYVKVDRWCKVFSDLGFLVEDPDFPPILACKRIAIRVLENVPYDSGTQDGPANFSEIDKD